MATAKHRNVSFPSLSPDRFPDPPSITTADRVIRVDSAGVIRMVHMVGEYVPGAGEFVAHTVPAAVVPTVRLEPGAVAPVGYGR